MEHVDHLALHPDLFCGNDYLPMLAILGHEKKLIRMIRKAANELEGKKD